MADASYSSGPKKGFKRCGIKSFTEAKVTPVILVCIYNQNSTLITHDLLYNAFISYGNILRILIFEKLKIWKAFVEFDNLDSAFEAKRDLNEFLLFNDGTRMNVYYSNLDTIKFQNNNAGGKDYTIESDGLEGEEAEVDPEFEAYGMGQAHEAASLYAGSNLSPHRMNYYESTGAMSPQSYAYQQMAPIQANKNETSFDDKDDEILQMINEHQNASISKKNSKEPQSINEEEKIEGDEHDKDLFSQFFNTTSTFQPSVRSNARTSNRARTQITLSLKSQAFSIRPSSPQGSTWQPQQQPNHGQVPPGLAFSSNGMIGKPKEQPKLIGYSNSFTQIPIPAMPLSATKPTSKFSNNVESQAKTGLIPKNISHFHSMHNIPTTNFVPTYHQILNNPPAEELGKIRQYPAIRRTDSRSSFEQQRNSSQGEAEVDGNGMCYEDLVEMIEQDIRNSSAGSGYNNTEDGRVGGLLKEKLGNGDVSNLSNMSLSTLSHLYNELSVLLGKTENIRKSNILFIKGLENSEVQVSMIYNIFSNFGNIVKICLMRSKACALIEFENTDHSSHAKEYLDNIIFMGSPLQISYSNGPIPSELQEGAGEDVFVGTTKTYRFKKTKTISINPPSATLHISNLPREVCNDEAVTNYFSNYGLIEGIRFRFVDNKNMCLLKLSCVEESVMAMAMLHDTDLGGRKVQISFTRSKF